MPRTALTDTATPAGTQPVGLAGYTDPVFSDEFRTGALDDTKWYPWYPDVPFWNTTTPGGHKTNSNEPQGYDESGISFPTDTTMRFTMRADNAAVPELDYTSGMVSSGDLFSQAYGVFEAKVRTPDIIGSWAAFWLFPASNSWDYEIDILEHWGAESFGNNVLTTVHPRDSTPAQSEGHTFPQDVGVHFHTYTLRWEPTRIRVYIDGTKVYDRTSSQMRIYNLPMYPQLNLAADRDKVAFLPTRVPFHMDVDYVRVWAYDPTLTIAETGAQAPTDPGGEPIDPEQPVELAFAPYSYDGTALDVHYLNNGQLRELGIN